MSTVVGWLLAAVALAAGWRSHGWPGVALAVSVIAFWLLMQFNRSVKVLRNASGSPVGHTESAVMLHAKLSIGMPMLKIVTLTRSLGKRVVETPETWAWADASGAEVRIVFEKGRCQRWALTRPAD